MTRGSDRPSDQGQAGSPASSILERWEGSTALELAERWQVPQVVLLSEVGSTNDFARSLAADAAPVGTTVLAERQLSGRGRSGRAWDSPPGLGLYLSFVARPAPDALPTYPLRVGLAVARASGLQPAFLVVYADAPALPMAQRVRLP